MKIKTIKTNKSDKSFTFSTALKINRNKCNTYKLQLGHLGLEPRTIRLKAEYSTIELVTLKFIQ